MKILFIIDTLETGGAEKSLLEITKRFKKYEPIFIQLFPGDSLKPQFTESGIEVLSMNFPVSYQFKKIAHQIIPVIQRIDPVLIHSSLFRSDMVAREVKKIIDVPVINSLVNNSYSKRRYKDLSLTAKIKLFVVETWDKTTSTNVDLFISNSEAIKLTNSKALNISPERIKVIYRGRDLKLFKDIKDAEVIALKQQLKLENVKIFLNVSRLLPRKGQSDLLNAFKKVHSKFPDTKLLIAGEGAYRQSLENQINELNIKDDVVLLGNRKDVPLLLKAADFFVFPSYYEGLPGALIEAIFSKSTIIASNIPENLECIEEKSVLLFKIGDVEDLERNMLKVLREEIPAPDIERGYDFAVENFAIQNVVMQYEQTYDELLERLN